MIEAILLLFLLLNLISIIIYTFKIGISPMPSSFKSRLQILNLLKDSSNNNIIDLGSGFGILSIFLASRLPDKNIIAYELSLVPWAISIILKKVLNIKNLHIYRKNYLKEDLHNSILVCYLFPKGMELLEDKLFDDCINTQIISNTFAFRNIKARDIIYIEDIYKTPIYTYKT
ncbi:methyltransferase [Poseidonibacter lekithochrous]|uniref:methyltransferase n=1 Tax=Poseidonibacter lekithochrous TaxID=1904463 RepID=UPI0008FC3A4E|nr:methyltransferase [Poseidonibacter lekithochrous]QKJ22663.1 methyltransferase [Poseidonibacter lekithochrous]